MDESLFIFAENDGKRVFRQQILILSHMCAEKRHPIAGFIRCVTCHTPRCADTRHLPTHCMHERRSGIHPSQQPAEQSSKQQQTSCRAVSHRECVCVCRSRSRRRSRKMRQFIAPLLLTVCFLLAIDSVASDETNPAAADEPGKQCIKLYHEIDDGTGITDRCCVKWRLATCMVNTASSMLRESSLRASKVKLTQAGCEKWANQIGESMPAACYWKYRQWVPITIGVVILVALIAVIASIVIVIRKRGRHAALRQAERT